MQDGRIRRAFCSLTSFKNFSIFKNSCWLLLWKVVPESPSFDGYRFHSMKSQLIFLKLIPGLNTFLKSYLWSLVSRHHPCSDVFVYIKLPCIICPEVEILLLLFCFFYKALYIKSETWKESVLRHETKCFLLPWLSDVASLPSGFAVLRCNTTQFQCAPTGDWV